MAGRQSEFLSMGKIHSPVILLVLRAGKNRSWDTPHLLCGLKRYGDRCFPWRVLNDVNVAAALHHASSGGATLLPPNSLLYLAAQLHGTDTCASLPRTAAGVLYGLRRHSGGELSPAIAFLGLL